jgi:hypothetical protein
LWKDVSISCIVIGPATEAITDHVTGVVQGQADAPRKTPGSSGGVLSGWRSNPSVKPEGRGIDSDVVEWTKRTALNVPPIVDSGGQTEQGEACICRLCRVARLGLRLR